MIELAEAGNIHNGVAEEIKIPTKLNIIVEYITLNKKVSGIAISNPKIIVGK